jgi:small subunit ribosomal protein S9
MAEATKAADAKKAVLGTGRRKTSIARVRLLPGEGRILVNGKPWEEYFLTLTAREAVRAPLVACEVGERFDVHVNVIGGGPEGQAGAVRHGLARALAKAGEGHEGKLREAGFLTRDSRRKERKKYGQRGARARFQFSKR